MHYVNSILSYGVYYERGKSEQANLNDGYRNEINSTDI